MGKVDFPRDLVVGDALSDPRHELRRVALYHCRIPGPNSWKRLIPASLPIVEPKVLNVAEVDRAQYGR